MNRDDTFGDWDSYREQQAENEYYDRLDALADAEAQRHDDYNRDDLWATPDTSEPVEFNW